MGVDGALLAFFNRRKAFYKERQNRYSRLKLDTKKMGLRTAIHLECFYHTVREGYGIPIPFGAAETVAILMDSISCLLRRLSI